MDSLVGWFSTVFTSVTTTLKDAWDGIVKFFLDIFNKLKSIFNTITLGVFSGGEGGSGGGANPNVTQQTNPFAAGQAAARARAKTPGTCETNQFGGFINEPTYAVGLKSGKTRLLGEAGPEVITPIGKTILTNDISGGGGTLNINVYGLYNITDFEAKIRPMVMRWMKESKSNRGIL